MLSRRGFLIGTGGLLTMAFVSDARAFIRRNEAPLLAAPPRTAHTLYWDWPDGLDEPQLSSMASTGARMSRPRTRVCLQDGLKLDLNALARRGFIKFGTNIGRRGIAWNHSYWGEIASGSISADMTNGYEGWLRVELGSFAQQITLISRSRHFGGRQWFFICPSRHRIATVLWKPPGANKFCSRQTWKGQVAYTSQYLDRDSRAHLGQSKINARLCSIGGFNAEDWTFPPKPKWMRWKTYHRHEKKFDRYEEILDYGCLALAAKLGGFKVL